MTMTGGSARIALVGDRSPHVRAHARIPGLLDALAERDQLVLDAYWIPSEEAGSGLAGFDAVWLMPGSPYKSEAGAVAAVRTAREGGIPFLGTCGGFQHALLEYARNVCGLTGAQHAEQTGDLENAVIIPLECSLVGHEAIIRLEPGSLAESILGTDRTLERYHCSYGLNPDTIGVFRDHGVHFTGTDENGEMRIAELPGHPFFVATMFQPELAGDGTRAHPIIRALAVAAVAHAGAQVKA